MTGNLVLSEKMTLEQKHRVGVRVRVRVGVRVMVDLRVVFAKIIEKAIEIAKVKSF